MLPYSASYKYTHANTYTNYKGHILHPLIIGTYVYGYIQRPTNVVMQTLIAL